MNILDRIVASARKRAETEKAEGLPPRCPIARPPFIFEKSLRSPDISFICEIKKASPSKGIIAEDFPYLDIAKEYEDAGAAAISVLTEPEFFLGSCGYLREIRETVDLPLLRKDFIIDKFQIEQSSRLGADAVLLICSVLSETELQGFIREADRFGLSSLVEVHNEGELKTAVRAGARVIGVNNRDLRTFEIDAGNSIRLKKMTPDDVIFVSESGVRTGDDVEILRKNNVDAALVGETLMRSVDKKAALEALRGRS